MALAFSMFIALLIIIHLLRTAWRLERTAFERANGGEARGAHHRYQPTDQRPDGAARPARAHQRHLDFREMARRPWVYGALLLASTSNVVLLELLPWTSRAYDGYPTRVRSRFAADDALGGVRVLCVCCVCVLCVRARCVCVCAVCVCRSLLPQIRTRIHATSTTALARYVARQPRSARIRTAVPHSARRAAHYVPAVANAPLIDVDPPPS